MDEFIRGFIEDVRETPRGFFAPLIVLWRLLKAESFPWQIH